MTEPEDVHLCNTPEEEEDTSSMNKSDYWSIGVKTLATSIDSSDFTVQVSPEDDLEKLFVEIESKTGLTAAQQRLIYRGRLIENSKYSKGGSSNGVLSDSPTSACTTPLLCKAKSEDRSVDSPIDETSANKKIKDIAGLTDGHTIHLVERKVPDSTSAARRSESSAGTSSSTHTTSTPPSARETTASTRVSLMEEEGTERNTNTATTGSSSPGAASLLAALLGMGNGTGSNEPSASPWIRNMNNNTNEDDDEDFEPESFGSRSHWRTRLAAAPSSRRRHMSYRLREEDLYVTDPGSMESVRQGLMTLHTLMSPIISVPNSTSISTAQTGHENTPILSGPIHVQHHKSPLDVQRRFYRGQWIDVRDTVNQWLEATIVEIVLPEEILPPPSSPDRIGKKLGPCTMASTDAAVSATDTDGRRRLLLEPCSEMEHEPNIAIELDAEGNPIYFRQRENNYGVQLLLVHYNGWPHRWDEWIRSDSERIRTFRTRTRHPNSGTNQRMSPTVQSSFSEAPPTFFLQQHQGRHREQEDRHALIPELGRVLSVVNGLVNQLSNETATVSSARSVSSTDFNRAHLPWITNVITTDRDDTIPEEDNEDEEEKAPSVYEVAPTSCEAKQSVSNNRQNSKRFRQDLLVLAPLLDRLGRIMVDAAPHVTALAASLESSQSDRQRIGQANRREATSDSERNQPSTLSGFLSLLSRDRLRTSVGSSNAAILGHDSVSIANSHEQATVASSSHREEDDDDEDDDDCGDEDDEASVDIRVDPDYTDFARGSVNTTRGEVRGSGPRSVQNRPTSGSNTSDELAGLLGAYLAAASLGGLVSSSTSDDDEGENSNPSAVTAQGLGRMVRERGLTGGNGIDIHIHAVVTAPGGNVGLATVGGGGGLGTTLFSTASSRTNRTSVTTNASTTTSIANHQNQVDEDEELGIFAELYSETPDPVDPTRLTDESLPVRDSVPPSSPEVDQLEDSLMTTNDFEATGFRNHRNSIDTHDNLFANLVSVSSSPSSQPVLFSRNSRRSGFVGTNSLGLRNSSSSSVSSSTFSNNEGASGAAPNLLLPLSTTPRSYSASTSGGSTSMTNNSTATVNTSGSSSTGNGRQNRGNVLTRLFRRSGHNDASNTNNIH